MPDQDGRKSAKPYLRIVDAETAEFYLKKAIKLQPQYEEPQSTIGYAHFCLAAVKGLLGLEIVASNEPEGKRLVGEALDELKAAEEHEHRPGYQYHLKGTLLFELNQFGKAAVAWHTSALQWRPPASKMFFNYACALSKLRKYKRALNALEQAVEVFDHSDKTPEVVPRFNPRVQARDNTEGKEFEPFWPGSTDAAATGAVSDFNKSFDEIVAVPASPAAKPTP